MKTPTTMFIRRLLCRECGCQRMSIAEGMRRCAGCSRPVAHVEGEQIGAIDDWSEVPAFANEDEEDAFWQTHGPSEKLLEQFKPVPIQGDGVLPRARRKK